MGLRKLKLLQLPAMLSPLLLGHGRSTPPDPHSSGSVMLSRQWRVVRSRGWQKATDRSETVRSLVDIGSFHSAPVIGSAATKAAITMRWRMVQAMTSTPFRTVCIKVTSRSRSFLLIVSQTPLISVKTDFVASPYLLVSKAAASSGPRPPLAHCANLEKPVQMDSIPTTATCVYSQQTAK